MVTAEKSELIIAVPAGPQTPEDYRHSDGSRLAIPTHRLLRQGAGLSYELAGRHLTGLVRGTNWRVIEFRGSDIPRAVAEGAADVGFTTSDKVLNLPDEEFNEAGELRRIEIMRQLGYGGCEYRLGIPVKLALDLGYPVDPKLLDPRVTLDPELHIDARLDVAEGKVVGEALENLARRIFRDHRVFPARFVFRDGHVENTVLPPRPQADLVVDIYETGGTMRDNKIIPANEQLMLFQAVEIRRKGYLGRSLEDMMARFDSRIADALENPTRWKKLQDRRFPQANPDFRIPQIPGIRQLTFSNTLVAV